MNNQCSCIKTLFMESLVNSPLGLNIFALDNNYKYLIFSKTHQEIMHNIWNVNIEEGTCMLDYISEQSDKMKAKKNFDRALVGEYFTIREDYGNNDLQRKVWKNDYSPIYDENKEVVGLSVIVHDLTDIIKHEKKSYVTEIQAEIDQQRKLFLNSIGDGLYGLDLEGKCFFVNPAALKILGFSENEIIGQNTHTLIHHHKLNGDIFPQNECIVHNVVTKNIQIAQKDWLFKKNGDMFPVELIVTPILKDDKVYGTVVSFRDITEKYEAEKLLKQEQFKKDLALQTGTISIWEWNYETDTLVWDDMMYHIYGFDKISIENPYSMWSSAVDLEDKPIVEKNLFHAQESNSEYNISFWITKPNGERRYIHAIGKNQFDEQGNAIRMVGINTDVTEIKEKDRLIAEQAKLSSMGELIGNIAHQWRQPLSVISTVASGVSLREENGLLAGYNLLEGMETIVNQANYLSKTIDDFRDFFQNDTILTSIPCSQILDKIVNIITPNLKTNNIELQVEINHNFTLNVYENHLLQAFINIINNAIDAIKEHILENDERIIKITTLQNNDGFEINIQDNGKGIPEDVLPRIFEPYFTTKHQSVGTGLGLTMAYKIITEHHKAKITAYNTSFTHNGNEYYGACFKIIF